MQLASRFQPPGTYTVQPGDSLQRIAKRLLGSAERWSEIFEANTDELSDPKMLFPGQVLTIPSARPGRPGGTPRGPAFPAPRTTNQPTTVQVRPELSKRFVRSARAFLDQPFQWGGGHQAKGTAPPGPVDGSGLVQHAGRMTGVNLDGTAAQQQRLGRYVAMEALQEGDLVFRGRPAHHVGIYLGQDRVLHASSRHGMVAITPLSESPHFDNAVRLF